MTTNNPNHEQAMLANALEEGRRKPGANIPIASLPNLRDLGGWPTADGGRVRSGLLYRSVELGNVTDADMPAVDALGLRTVYDLRTDAERSQTPDRVPQGADHVVVNVLADLPGAQPAQMLQVLHDPKGAEKMLGGGKGAKMMEETYPEFVTLGSALKGWPHFFSGIAQEQKRPALFHCTTGKDRTGWAAASTLTLLGVSEDDVMREYLLTNDQLLPALKPVFDKFASQGGDPKMLRPVLGVEPQYLKAAFDEMRKKYGTIQKYFADGLGLGADVQTALRDAFVERS
jgi:protein-tyrosine phosphatase